MSVTLLAAATAVFWGLAPLGDHAAAQRTGALSLTFWQSTFGLVAAPVAIAVDPAQALHQPSLPFLLWATLSGLVVFGAWATYLVALTGQEGASVAVALMSAYPLLTAFLLVVFFSQHAVVLTWLGTAAICVGAYLVQRSGGNSEGKRKMLGFSGLSTVCWGLWGVSDWNALRYGTPLQLVVAGAFIGFGFSLLAGIVLMLRGGSLRLPRAAWAPALAASLLYSASAFTFYFALAKHAPVYVVAVTATYPLVTILGGWVRGAERVTVARLAAITVMVAGVALIQQ